MAEKHFVCSAIIKETNTLDVPVLYGVASRDKIAESHVLDRQFLVNSVCIEHAHTDGLLGSAYNPHKVHLRGKVRVADNNILDIRYEVPFGLALHDKVSEAYIHEHSNFISSMYVEPAHTDGLFGKAYNPFKSQLQSSVRVLDYNLLDINFKLIQPPVETLVVGDTQDTFIRQSKPTINYGDSQTLAVGRAGDGEYRSFIDIDLTDIINLINSGMNITSMDLIINKLPSSDGILYIHECYSTWYENYLIWLTTVNYSENPIFIYEAKGNQVIIDIAEYVDSLIKQGKTKLSLILKSDDFILLNSKESGLPPRIEVRYTDPSWAGETGECFFGGNATVRAVSTKDFYSSYRLREKSHLFGNAIKRDTNLVEGKAWKNKPYITSSATPVISDYRPGYVFIKDRKDLAGGAYKNPYLGESRAYIPGRKELFSSASIPPDEGIFERADTAFILKKVWLSDAEVVRSSYFNGFAVVRQDGLLDISSVAYTQQQPTGKAYFRIHNNLTSNAVLRGRNLKDVPSDAEVNVPWVVSSYRLRKSSDNVGFVRIRAFEKKDMPSSVYVTNDYILSRYSLRVSKDIYASAFIKQFENYSIESCVVIPPPSDVISNVVVRRSSDIDFVSGGVKRRSDTTDVRSYVEYSQHKSLISNADLFRVSEITATAILRQFDVDDKNSQAFVVGGFYRYHVPSYFFVRQPNAYFNGRAVIHTWARPWRPDVEGELTFDRKLPRKWRREDFIEEGTY